MKKTGNALKRSLKQCQNMCDGLIAMALRTDKDPQVKSVDMIMYF